ncbi:MAG: sulfotransferase domain-containing protein [Alphaproteobacteria bacterium]|nr:MAG: sulfotransferase domain-containing protein [Alphaproteobacteria bacterium]
MEKPQILHDYRHHHLDGPRWEDFTPRDDDVVISTTYKAGTTWMQTIVGNLIFAGKEIPGRLTEISPWLDMRLSPHEETLQMLEEQTHRRYIKTHLPLDGLKYFDNVKYIMVGRDARDVFMSLINHYGNHTDEFIETLNSLPDRVGDPFPKFDGDIHKLWKNWMTRGWFDWETDGWPYWSHLHHAQTWWDYKDLPNIELFHYADMLADLEGQMRRVAKYLDMEIEEELWPSLVDACTFATVKKDPSKVVMSMADFAWKGGGDTFINKGTNGRWHGVLSDEELELYEAAKNRAMTPECAKWLENGWNGKA